LVFILPVESGERVSYAITVLLSIAVFLTLVGDNIPKSSKPMSLFSYYLLFDLILSTVIVFATIVNLKVYHQHVDKPVPKWLSRTVRKLKCCKTTPPIYVESTTTDGTVVTWIMVSGLLDGLMLATCILWIFGTTSGFLIVMERGGIQYDWKAYFMAHNV
jgi:hypothetical protein